MTPRVLKIRGIEKTNDFVTITFPRGFIYDGFIIKARNTGAANLNAPAVNAVFKGIELVMAGETQRKFDAVQGNAVNALFGDKWAASSYAGNTFGLANANGAGELHYPVLFREPRSRLRRDSVDVDTLGWKTDWLPEKNPLQCIIGNALGANLDVQVDAIVRDGDDSATAGPGRIIKWFSPDQQLGQNPGSLLNWANNVKAGDKFVQWSLFNSSGGKSVVQILLEAGGAKFFDNTTKAAMNTLLKIADLDPVGADAIANAVHLAMDRYDDINDALPKFAESLLEITMSAAANGEGLTSLVQRYGFPQGYNP